MRKIVEMALCMVLIFSFSGCGDQKGKTEVTFSDTVSVTDMETAEISNDEKNEMDISDVDENDKSYTYNVVFVDWTDDSSIYTLALNTEKMIDSSVQHLPVYKFDTKTEFDSFINFYSDILMNQGLDEAPSFEYITAEQSRNL